MPIALNGKRKIDRHSFSRNREAIIGGVFFKNAFLIIQLHWHSFHLPRIGVGICREDYVGKIRGNNPGPGTGIADGDGRVDNPDTSTNIADIDKKVDNPAINTDKIDKDREVDNSSISINIADAEVNKREDLGTSIGIADIDVDGRADNPDNRILDTGRRVDNLKIGTRTRDKWLQAIKSARLFSLYVKPIFFIFSSELEIISVFLLSSFFFSLALMTLLKQRSSFSIYSVVKMCMFSLNKAPSSISSLLTLSKFFTRYFQLCMMS